MRKSAGLPVVLVLLAGAGAAVVWRFGPAPEPAGQPAAADARQAAIGRTLQRTLRESRGGEEPPRVEAAPIDGSGRQDGFADSDSGTDSGTDSDSDSGVGAGAGIGRQPDTHAFGTYRGQMRRAPLPRNAGAEPASNPEWLEPDAGRDDRAPTGEAGGAANPAWLKPDAGRDAILRQAARSGREATFAVLRLDAAADLRDLSASLARLGAVLEGFSGEYARVRIPADRGALEAASELRSVLGIGAVPAAMKAGEAFVQAMRARPAGELAPVHITLMGEDRRGEWRDALAELGATVGAWDPDLRSYTANLPAAALGRVIAEDFVLAVEPVPAVTSNHASAVPVMGVDGLRSYDAATRRFAGATGSGIAVGVLDTGLNTSHMDIAHGRSSICGANFVADEDWDLWVDLEGHGTHVFGTIAGAGRSDPLLAGVAPGVTHLRFGKVLSAGGFGSGEDIRRGMDYLSRPSGCPSRAGTVEAVRPLIVNMSLSGVSLAFSGRGVGERKLDSVVHAHSQLYVVAQANAGVHGFSNYGTAKNSLAVGAVDDAGIIAGFSSQGPTFDGRLAPNVVGTGIDLTSARGGASVSGYNTLSGTSMAAPSVAGVAALLMQARPEFRNRPALTRARLMASAVRPGAYRESRAWLPGDNTDGPGGFNHRYGLGLVSARTSLFSKDDPDGWLIGSASARPDNGSYEYIDIEVPRGASQLDVVLTWDEQPADTLTRSVLNNLDLWADREADCGEGACGEHASRSEVDNVEWLLIEDPAPGTYRIKVIPVQTYGEPSTAAVAWKILRGPARPRLALKLEREASGNAGGKWIAIDVTVETAGYVASGTTVHLNCRPKRNCARLRDAYLAHGSRVHREDGLSAPAWVEWWRESSHIPIGEVAAGAPGRVQLRFLREAVPEEATVLHVTATSWNKGSASHSITIGRSVSGAVSGPFAPRRGFYQSVVTMVRLGLTSLRTMDVETSLTAARLSSSASRNLPRDSRSGATTWSMKSMVPVSMWHACTRGSARTQRRKSSTEA